MFLYSTVMIVTIWDNSFLEGRLNTKSVVSQVAKKLFPLNNPFK